MLHRSISAAAAALGAAIWVHLAWYELPFESGLAFGRALLSTIFGVALLIRSVRLEVLHAMQPQPGNTRGPFQLSVALVLLADAAHGYVLAMLERAQLLLMLLAGCLLALAVHTAIELTVRLRTRSNGGAVIP